MRYDTLDILEAYTESETAYYPRPELDTPPVLEKTLISEYIYCHNHMKENWTMARMSLDEVAENRESMEIDVIDLPPITEELSAAERAEFERSLHLVQPAPSNKFVVFTDR